MCAKRTENCMCARKILRHLHDMALKQVVFKGEFLQFLLTIFR